MVIVYKYNNLQRVLVENIIPRNVIINWVVYIIYIIY